MNYNTEKFTYNSEGISKCLELVGTVDLQAYEYQIAEDEYGAKYALVMNDDEELEMVDNNQTSDFVIRKWEEETYGAREGIESWDEDEYVASNSYEEDDSVENSLSYVEDFVEDY